jgi:hypothetical protein
MMRENYKPVLTVSLLHNYFKNGLCNDALLKPDALTKQLFTRFNFLARNTENGVVLYIGSKTPVADLLKYISKSTGVSFFRFSILVSEPQFLMITQLPVDQAGMMIYDTKHVSGNSKDGDLQLEGVLSADPAVDCMGMLTVHFDDIVNFETVNDHPQFIISFKARSTLWQYYIINKTQFSFKNLSIAANKDTPFGDPATVVTEDGNTASLFSSLTLIPLSQEPLFQFDLVYNAAGKNGMITKTLYKGLPLPAPDQFGLIQVQNESQLSSPMYVYL